MKAALTACQIIGLLISLPEFFYTKEQIKAFEERPRILLVNILKSADKQALVIVGCLGLIALTCLPIAFQATADLKATLPFRIVALLVLAMFSFAMFFIALGIVTVVAIKFLQFIVFCPKGVLPAIGFPAFIFASIAKILMK